MSKIDDDLKALSMSAAIDQAMANWANVALLLTRYMAAFVEAGMTADCAFRLTRDYHRLLIGKQLWPDAPPVFGDDGR